MRDGRAEGRSILPPVVRVRPFSEAGLCILNGNSNEGGFVNVGIRILCLVCTLAVLMVTFFGIQAQAQGRDAPLPVYPRTPKGSTVRTTAPLFSAMMLVLGGLGISLLFDKKDKDK